MKFPGFADTLRFKLVVTSLLIQTIFVTVLVINGTRLIEDSLVEQSKLRLSELAQLLNTSLAAPMLMQDIELIDDILESNLNEGGIIYSVLLNNANQIIASKNWSEKNKLPEAMNSLKDAVKDLEGHYDTKTIIQINGQQYGTLYYGISLAFLSNVKQLMFEKSILISVVGIFISLSVLFFSVLWLTRHLSRLAEANEQFAHGKLEKAVPVRSNDEVGFLTESFNTMVKSLDLRIADLHNSQHEQGLLLETVQGEKAKLTSLLGVMTRGILFETLDHKVAYFNSAFINIWKLESDELWVNQDVADVKVRIEKEIRKEFSDNLLTDIQQCPNDDVIESKTNDGRVVSYRCYPVHDDAKKVQGTLWVFDDITVQKRTAKELIFLAEHDFLTGVYNRRKFQEELESQLRKSERNDHSLALLFFDIDDFKYINDIYGHEYGDKILLQVATEISRLIRRDEMFCRLGGDEFAIVLPEGDEASAVTLANRILKAVSRITLKIADKTVSVTSSVGVSVYPDHATEMGALLACADVAMYQSKSAGKNTWNVYEKTHGFTRKMLSQVNWVNRIDQAFEKGLFELRYQGVFDSNTRELYCYEALIRMRGIGGDIHEYQPAEFISVAEGSGRIMEIDQWVVREAISVLSRNSSIPCLSINISGRSFNDDELSGLIIFELKKMGVSPHRLLLEITETAMVADIEVAQRFINRIREHGCRVCIDDFGSGYSSFIYLKHLDVDVIKIDGMFTCDLPHDYRNQVFVKAIVDIAKGLGKKTVAEFVEDEETSRMLATFGVDFVQGFYFHEPQKVTRLAS